MLYREEELAGRVEVLEKLRTTAREAERDKRDSEKRYREQVCSSYTNLCKVNILLTTTI